MGRFAHSWELVKASFGVVRHDKELLILPILSFLASVMLVLAVLGIGLGADVAPQVTDPATGDVNLVGLALAFALYLGLSFVQVFFAGAVVAAAHERMAGGNPTLGSALRAAGRRAGRLFLWSIIAATVSVVLQMLRERGGQAGRLVAGLGGLAWNIATYFVVPVLMFEDVRVMQSIGRSGSVLKRTWGEALIGSGGIGLVFGLAIMAVGIVGILLASQAFAAAGLAALVATLVLVGFALVVLATLQSVLGGVYKAALYRFATTGSPGAGFSAEQLRGAFVHK